MWENERRVQVFKVLQNASGSAVKALVPAWKLRNKTRTLKVSNKHFKYKTHVRTIQKSIKTDIKDLKRKIM